MYEKLEYTDQIGRDVGCGGYADMKKLGQNRDA